MCVINKWNHIISALSAVQKQRFQNQDQSDLVLILSVCCLVFPSVLTKACFCRFRFKVVFAHSGKRIHQAPVAASSCLPFLSFPRSSSPVRPQRESCCERDVPLQRSTAHKGGSSALFLLAYCTVRGERGWERTTKVTSCSGG